jgi:hypothetical protein
MASYVARLAGPGVRDVLTCDPSLGEDERAFRHDLLAAHAASRDVTAVIS